MAVTNLIVALKFTRSKLRGVILSQGKGRDFISYVKIFALFFTTQSSFLLRAQLSG
nr:MAG TPA: hypothetical protein [Caudoviricetes sp.]